MPGIPGENLLTTLFADVHYYFNDPSSKSLHHRFSKGSYAYIYYNPAEHRGKLEVANHAGTPDQDAFSGYLSAVNHVRYSYKHPTLCTVVLATPSIQGHDEWHLPAFDLRNEQKYLYKIHTLEIYLWTEKDAATFLGHLKAVLPADKLDIRDAPAALEKPAEHRDSMSPVVQLLEKTAVSAHFPPRAESTASTHSFPGPPTPSTGVAGSPTPQRQQQPSPMAMTYNPAAPAAPEPIAHREKTPPPVEDGHGLSGNRAPPPAHMQFASIPQGYQPSQQNTPQQSYFPGPPHLQQQRQPSNSSMHMLGPPQGTPPNTQRNHSGSLPLPPPQAKGPSPSQYAPSFGPPPTDSQSHPASPPPNQTSFHRQSMIGQPTQQFASYPSQQFASYPQSPGFGPSVGTPGMPPTPGFMQQQQQQQQQPPTPSAPPSYNTHTPLQSPAFPPTQSGSLPPPPIGQPPSQQQQQPIGGYSSYSYSQAGQAQPGAYNPHGAYTGDVHSQVYRPTETEAAHGALARPAMQAQEGSKESFSGKYKVNDRVDKVEKGVGRFLKKLDSKW